MDLCHRCWNQRKEIQFFVSTIQFPTSQFFFNMLIWKENLFCKISDVWDIDIMYFIREYEVHKEQIHHCAFVVSERFVLHSCKGL